MPSDFGLNDYLNSLEDIDRDSIGVVVRTVQKLYGQCDEKTATLSIYPEADDNEINLFLGLRDYETGDVFKSNLRFLYVMLRQNFHNDIFTYKDVWELTRIDYDEAAKQPSGDVHVFKPALEGAKRINIFFERQNNNPLIPIELGNQDYPI